MCKAIQRKYCKLYLVNLDNRKGYKQSWSFLYCLKLFSSRLSYLSSQVTISYTALYTIQIVSKQLHINNSVNKFIN